MSILVSPKWLFDRLHQADTVVFDASLVPVGKSGAANPRDTYVAGHIPGALFFDIEKLSDQRTKLPHMLSSAEEFSSAMSGLGVSEDLEIVVYEQDGVFSAPRAWWMLRAFGAQRVHLLDGGLRAWVAEGYPVLPGPVARPSRRFNSSLDSVRIRSFEQIQELILSGGQIVDARSAGRFSGVLPEPREGLSSGHLPGAINLPFSELQTNGRMKPISELRTLFSRAGIDLNRPITTMCGSGVTAAILVAGLELTGAKQVSLYDGSWSDYASRPDTVILKKSENQS
ncbi:MAG: 3-mercaptopyruvate sulfurtransferase [Bdellovibrionales bacterium]|nr:3-mercaptopyruvate sulfurtransferase [Bdellovibrionales bacterium]